MKDVEELIERLKAHAWKMDGPVRHIVIDISRAASTLQSQARRVEELAQDVIALAEHCGELADMHDGPCYVFDGLCAASVCQSVGCIKDKADRARSALAAQVEDHE